MDGAPEIGVMGRALRMAHRLGVIDRLPEIPRPPKGEHRTRFLNEEEITRLLDACRQSRNRFLAPLVTLALTTGARYSELTTLTWTQVDLDADFGLSPVIRLEVDKALERACIDKGNDPTTQVSFHTCDTRRRPG